jgi:proteasome lid subunit RPN8/RPN11
MTWKDIALKHAKEDAPHEACGLLAVYKGKEKYFPCKNLAEDLGEQFIIDPDDWVKAEDLGEIIAVFHSHPQVPPLPSQADLASCEYLDLPFYIVTPETEQWHYFEPSGYKKGLIGRQWVWDIQDCWSLITDWYKETKNISIRHWKRPASPQEFTKDPYFEKVLLGSGFIELNEEEDTQKEDILLMDTTDTGKLDHVALYIGDQTILHHCVKRLSCREIYDQKYIQWTKKRYRYAQ